MILTLELLEEIRFYVGQVVRKQRIAANNARLNGYKEVALQQENEAVLGEKILRGLAQENKTNARQEAYDQGQ